MKGRSPIVVGLVVALGLALFAFIVVLPRGGALEQRRARLAEVQAELTSLEADVAELQALEAQGIATDGLEEARTSIPSTAQLSEFFGSLREAAATSEVALVSIGPGTATLAPAGSLSSIPVSISVEGEYFALARFLFELEHLERLVRISGVSVASGAGVLSMQVSAEIYTTDGSVGPGSDPGPGTEIG